MAMKAISSTKAKNHFGGILDDIIQNNTKYIIKRHGTPQAIVLSLSDFEEVLNDAQKQYNIGRVIRELKPEYDLGETILQE
jgi:prevent-host-death family protein